MSLEFTPIEDVPSDAMSPDEERDYWAGTGMIQLLYAYA